MKYYFQINNAKVLITLLLILLPIDWFYLTGNSLREFGAKPANVLLLAIAVFAILESKKRVFSVTIILSFLFIYSFTGFLISINNISDFLYAKNPVIQFASHTFLIGASILMVYGNSIYFAKREVYQFMPKAIYIASFIHLSFFFFELFYPEVFREILLNFRTRDYLLERPSGLMSEPSYYGAMSGLYGIPLLLSKGYKNNYRVIGLLLIITSIYTGAKTVLVISIFASFPYIITRSVSKFTIFLMFSASLAVIWLFISSRSLFNFDTNMSTVMRIGSAHLGINYIIENLPILGIGAGQFHYVYIPNFAPDYLFLSNEANLQMTSSVEHRASTYNLFIRILIEYGIVGMLLFYKQINRIIRIGLYNKRILEISILFASLGFLMTQDTYAYPPLIIALSLIIGHNSLIRQEKYK